MTLQNVEHWNPVRASALHNYMRNPFRSEPVGLSIMLRAYFLQQWFNLSDPGAEDALYESPVLRRCRR